MVRRKGESTPSKDETGANESIASGSGSTPFKKAKVSTVVTQALSTFAESNKDMVASVKAVLERRSDDPEKDARMELLIKTQQELIKNLSERNGVLVTAIALSLIHI